MSLSHSALPRFFTRGGRVPRRTGALAGTALILGFVVLAVWGIALVQTSSGQGAAAPLIATQGGEDRAYTQPLTATVYLPMVNRPPNNAWFGEYYANASLSGEPAYTIADQPRVDYDWGDGAPSGLPVNYFSIRWTGGWDFEAGEYTFFVFADDGVRLWLDGQLLIDHWLPGSDWYPAETSVTEGPHQLKLEYYENTGKAGIQIRWRRTDLYPTWQGNYYDNNAYLQDGVDFHRTDSVIQFDWGLGCPVELSYCDNFSVAWNTTRLFEPGTHRIYIYADEGYQLYVDGVKKGEGGWLDGQTGGSVDVSYPLEISGLESHQIRYNFHDRGGEAEARLWIEYLEQPDWTAQYYGNKSLSGTPVVVASTEKVIFYDWGWGKPRSALPSADDFSVRWTGDRYFHSGTYRFKLYADDGVRLWVDGELLVDHWTDGYGEYPGKLKYLGTGYHHFVVEYYEHTGLAEIRFWWE